MLLTNLKVSYVPLYICTYLSYLLTADFIDFPNSRMEFLSKIILLLAIPFKYNPSQNILDRFLVFTWWPSLNTYVVRTGSINTCLLTFMKVLCWVRLSLHLISDNFFMKIFKSKRNNAY